MPFITQDRREAIDQYGLQVLTTIAVGDICYTYYKFMVDEWKANPCWTTAHNIYKKMVYSLEEDEDCFAAYSLAWQVFFQLCVMPYELKKREENGNI